MSEKRGYKNLLVPIRHPNDVNRIAEFAETIMNRGTINFLTVVKEDEFSKMQSDWRKSTKIIGKYKDKITSKRIRVKPKIRYSNSIWRGILDQAEEEDSDLIVMGWGRKITFRSLNQTPIERVFANSKRDVVAFKNRTGSVNNIQKILFPIGYKDYDYSKRLALTSQIIKSTGADCVLTHILTENETEEDAKEILQKPKEFMLDLGVDCETKIMEHQKIPDALIEESQNYDLLVLGPTKEYVFSRYLFGWMTDEIVNNSECSAMILKEGEQKWKAWLRGTLDAFKKELKDLFK
ncbi:MAG: universal stress protein [Hadesarchaea archaeon]|nr:universal stress protein [Hadesarchaea archaeon]